MTSSSRFGVGFGATQFGGQGPERVGANDQFDLVVAARTYREWARASRPVAGLTISDAQVVNQVRDLAWMVDHEGTRRLTPEGLYGRRKMTALVQRTSPAASPGSVDRAMRSLGLQGVRRSKGVRTTIPARDGKRAGDLLDRAFTADAPNRTWVMDFTYVRTWVGFVYVAFILDVFAQKIVAWNVAPSFGTYFTGGGFDASEPRRHGR